MKTEDLVSMLASSSVAVPPHAAARRYGFAVGGGALVALTLMVLLLGVRADLADAAQLPMFWFKLAYVGGLLMASLLASLRLSRPGARLTGLASLLMAPVLAMWLWALVVLTRAAPAARSQLFYGETWTDCPLLIASLSAPVFVAVIWAMQGLAPTRLHLAGAAAGLLAGTTGALVYCLHCPEIEAPFLAFWYLLGMLIPATAGAAVGPRLLRW